MEAQGLTGARRIGAHTSQFKNIISKFKAEMTTPGWQFIWKVAVFLIFIFIFGAVYHFHIAANPKEWFTPKDKDGNVIVNGIYTSAVVTGTIGYGDYYPQSMAAIAIVMVNTLIAWILFTTFLG